MKMASVPLPRTSETSLPHNTSGVLPLSMLAPGERARIFKVNAGDALGKRLNAMGLTSGIEVKIIQDAGGTLLLAVRDSRLAVGRGIAQKILVEIIPGEIL